MGKSRLYSKGWRAQIRLSRRDGGHCSAGVDLLQRLDGVLRRASSVERYAIRFELIPDRRELLFRIAALRHEPSDRLDSVVIPILRRFVPTLSKGAWTPMSEGSNTLAFTDYELAADTAIAAEMAELLHNPSEVAFVSAHDTPAIACQAMLTSRPTAEAMPAAAPEAKAAPRAAASAAPRAAAPAAAMTRPVNR